MTSKRIIIAVVVVLGVIALVKLFQNTGSVLTTYQGSYTTKYEGEENTYNYSFSYPADKFLVETSEAGNEVTLKDKVGDAVNRIVFFYNGAAGVLSSEELWQTYVLPRYASSSCADCAKQATVLSNPDIKDMISYGNDKEEWIVYQGGPGFVIGGFVKPSDEARKVFESLTIEKEMPGAATTTPSGDAIMEDKTGGTMTGTEMSGGMTLKIALEKGKASLAAVCNQIVSVNRTLPKTSGVAKAAIQELLKGPTVSEKTAGYESAIPEGLVLNSIKIVNGEAQLDFNKELETTNDQCNAAMGQVQQTLLQFPTIKTVKVSVNGHAAMMQP